MPSKWGSILTAFNFYGDLSTQDWIASLLAHGELQCRVLARKPGLSIDQLEREDSGLVWLLWRFVSAWWGWLCGVGCVNGWRNGKLQLSRPDLLDDGLVLIFQSQFQRLFAVIV